MTPDSTPEDEAARKRRQAAAGEAGSRMLNAVGAVSLLLEDPAHITDQPIWKGAHSTERRARPLTRLQAAVWLRGAADNQLRSRIGEARAAGASWADIAGVLDLPDTDDPAAAAWEQAVGQGWGERFHFTCGTCGAGIVDHGPYDPHPDDRETGHAETCERHRAALAAWRKTVLDD